MPISQAPDGPLWATMTSSTKSEVHNVLKCRQKKTEPQPQLTRAENFVKFGDMWSLPAERQRDIQTCSAQYVATIKRETVQKALYKSDSLTDQDQNQRIAEYSYDSNVQRI